MGEDNPGFLGELRFTRIGHFEWVYKGHQLQETEVWQIVNFIQNYAAGKVPVIANGIMMPPAEEAEELPLHFKNGKNQKVG